MSEAFRKTNEIYSADHLTKKKEDKFYFVNFYKYSFLLILKLLIKQIGFHCLLVSGSNNQYLAQRIGICFVFFLNKLLPRGWSRPDAIAVVTCHAVSALYPYKTGFWGIANYSKTNDKVLCKPFTCVYLKDIQILSLQPWPLPSPPLLFSYISINFLFTLVKPWLLQKNYISLIIKK